MGIDDLQKLYMNTFGYYSPSLKKVYIHASDL